MTSASAQKLKKRAADFEAKKQLDKALGLYIQLLEEADGDLDDADLQLYNRVGDLLTRQGNVNEALGWYEKAIDIYAERGFLNNAIALCNKVLRQAPSRSSVYYKLGKISASKGFKSDAKKNFLEYADRMQKAGQIDEAFRALKEFADLCPDQDDIRLMLADWLTRENRKSEAVEQLETLWNKFESEGRRHEATATLDRMKAIDPEFVPRASGAWISQKSSDLVFLDLAVDAPPTRAVEETPAVSQSASPAVVPAVSVPALEGLTLTFIPDDDEGVEAARPEGFVEEVNAPESTPNERLSGLEAMELETTEGQDEAPSAHIELLAEVDGYEGREDVAALPGLESAAAEALGAEEGIPSAAKRATGDVTFISLDLEAVMAEPPRSDDITLDVEIPLLEAATAPATAPATVAPEPIDLLAILATPIVSAVVERAPAEPLAPLDILDLSAGADSVAARASGVTSAVASDAVANVAAANDAAAKSATLTENETAAAEAPDETLRDTAELVAIDGSARVTDEIAVVESVEDEVAHGTVLRATHGLDGDETPDSWVEAALGAPRNDLNIDRLLTPLGVPVIGALDASIAADAPVVGARPSFVPANDIEAAKAEAYEFDEFGTPAAVPGGAAREHGVAGAGAGAGTGGGEHAGDGVEPESLTSAESSAAAAGESSARGESTVSAEFGESGAFTESSARSESSEFVDSSASIDSSETQEVGNSQSDVAASAAFVAADDSVNGDLSGGAQSLESFFGIPKSDDQDIDLLDELTPPFMREGHDDASDGAFTSGEVARAFDAVLDEVHANADTNSHFDTHAVPHSPSTVASSAETHDDSSVAERSDFVGDSAATEVAHDAGIAQSENDSSADGAPNEPVVANAETFTLADEAAVPFVVDGRSDELNEAELPHVAEHAPPSASHAEDASHVRDASHAEDATASVESTQTPAQEVEARNESDGDHAPPTSGTFDFDFAAADREAQLESDGATRVEDVNDSALASSVLDTASLRAAMVLDVVSHDDADALASSDPSSRRPAGITPPDEAMIEAAFRENPIELPLLDVGDESASPDEETAYRTYDPRENATPQSFLAQPPSFDSDRETFEPEPSLSSDTLSPDEWPNDEDVAPEVLIDGEWRDEHVGDLVSGEVRAVTGPNGPHARFDDLAAAMLWPADHADTDDDDAADTHLPMPSQSGTVSFGGVEAQLRRRLEIDPGNWALRRMLGEELVAVGEREAAMAEFELAMAGFESLGDLENARQVADSVLRAFPNSVRHHQKRVEFAVLSGNRGHLIEAYVELADALFRSGDAPKAQVVYSRVLELSPGNQRARVALGLIAPDEGYTPPTPTLPATLSPSSGGMVGLFTHPSRSPRPASSVTEEMPSIDDVTIPSAPLANPSRTPTPAPAGLRAHTPPSSAPLAHETPPRVASLENQVAAATPWAIEPRIERATPPAPPPPTSESAESFVDLGDWLRATEPVRSTRMVTSDVAPTGDEQADFDDMLRRFKQGIAENVDEEDFSSHYDLGVAYKEMGLIDEAISEFQKALRGEEHRERAYEALGQCFVEKGQMQVAITLLKRAVETPGADDQKLVGVLYLLGFANETMERHRDALGYYQRVFAVDIEFRDVAKRVAAMEHRTK